MTDCVVALDVGGSGMKGAAIGRDGARIASLRRRTARDRGPDAVVRGIAAHVRALAERARAAGARPVAASVAVPGVVDDDRGIAVFSANLGWRDRPLRAELERAVGLPLTLSHDVRSGGLAEAMLGAGRGVRDLLFMPIGTGIAAAIVLDRRPYPGTGGGAGELGHVLIDPAGPPCGCGRRGCLETLASAAAVVAGYRARVGGDGAERPGRREPAARRPARRGRLGAQDVAARASAGDPDAQAVWERATDAMAAGLAIATTMLAPEVVVIGGGLAGAGDQLLHPVERGLAARLAFERPPRLAIAELGDEASCLGAALVGWRALGAADEELGWRVERGA